MPDSPTVRGITWSEAPYTTRQGTGDNMHEQKLPLGPNSGIFRYPSTHDKHLGWKRLPSWHTQSHDHYSRQSDNRSGDYGSYNSMEGRVSTAGRRGQGPSTGHEQDPRHSSEHRSTSRYHLEQSEQSEYGPIKKHFPRYPERRPDFHDSYFSIPENRHGSVHEQSEPIDPGMKRRKESSRVRPTNEHYFRKPEGRRELYDRFTNQGNRKPPINRKFEHFRLTDQRHSSSQEPTRERYSSHSEHNSRESGRRPENNRLYSSPSGYQSGHGSSIAYTPMQFGQYGHQFRHEPNNEFKSRESGRRPGNDNKLFNSFFPGHMDNFYRKKLVGNDPDDPPHDVSMDTHPPHNTDHGIHKSNYLEVYENWP